MPTRFPARSVRVLVSAVLKGLTLTAVLVLSLTGLACSSTPTSDRLPPQTMSSEGPPAVGVEEGPDPREPVVESEPVPEEQRSPVTVVIEDGVDGRVRGQSLVEAAAEERKRRESSGGSTTVVTDKNLRDFRGGQVTEMGGSKAPPVREPQQPGANSGSTAPSRAVEGSLTGDSGNLASPDELGDEEAYWRGRVLQARVNWAEAAAENRRLKSKVAELRQRFYAEEDPYYRDSQIKPSWDRALDRLEETRTAIEEYRVEVRNVLEAGRRASALPGWLREGIDLEPDIIDRHDAPAPPSEYLPGEPRVADDPDGPR